MLVMPSGYEMCLKRLCNLVKSRVLADISIKIGEMIFRTFVHFFELFGGVFPQLFPMNFTHMFAKKMGNQKIYFGGFRNE